MKTHGDKLTTFLLKAHIFTLAPPYNKNKTTNQITSLFFFPLFYHILQHQSQAGKYREMATLPKIKR